MRRWLRYRLIIPLFRSPHDAAHTARGVAIGVFWALTPTIGLQTIEILATWLLLGRVLRKDSSLVQAMIWVWINNPLTVVPMYYAFYVTGLWLTGRRGAAIDYNDFTVSGLTWANVGIPMLAGCIPYAIAGACLSYQWALRLVRLRRERRAAKFVNYETFRTYDSSR